MTVGVVPALVRLLYAWGGYARYRARRTLARAAAS